MNWLAILVAAITTFMIGWVWYGMIFKNAWMAETGITDEKAKEGNMPVTFGLSLVFSFMVALFLYGFVWHECACEAKGVPDPALFHTFKHGLFHGVILGVFVILPTLGTNALYEQKSWKYILINVGYWVVSCAAMGGILNVWR